MEEVVKFNTAQKAKDRGFNIPTISHYTPKGYCTESEGYQTERLEESNWNNGKGSYPTLPKDVSCSAPSQSVLAKWLREEHNIDVVPYPSFMGGNKNYYYIIIKDRNFDNILQGETNNYSYEEAFEIGLFEALNLLSDVS